MELLICRLIIPLIVQFAIREDSVIFKILRQTNVGKLADAQALVALMDLIHCDNSKLLTTENFVKDGSGVDIAWNYLLNNKIANVEEADVLLLTGTNSDDLFWLCPEFVQIWSAKAGSKITID